MLKDIAGSLLRIAQTLEEGIEAFKVYQDMGQGVEQFLGQSDGSDGAEPYWPSKSDIVEAAEYLRAGIGRDLRGSGPGEIIGVEIDGEFVAVDEVEVEGDKRVYICERADGCDEVACKHRVEHERSISCCDTMVRPDCCGVCKPVEGGQG